MPLGAQAQDAGEALPLCCGLAQPGRVVGAGVGLLLPSSVFWALGTPRAAFMSVGGGSLAVPSQWSASSYTVEGESGKHWVALAFIEPGLRVLVVREAPHCPSSG